MARGLAVLAVAALTVGLLAGCAQSRPNNSTSPRAATSTSTSLTGSITVDAAASLSSVFPALQKAFEAQHPKATITFNFGGSSTLAASIVSGAPVDVFAAASTKTMQTVQDAGLTEGTPVVIAKNKLEIAVLKGNPGNVIGLKDFANAAKTVVLCDKTVPCGAAAQQVFQLAQVAAKPDSYEPDVTSVLTKVSSGDADAGLVYVIDVKASHGKVAGVPFPEANKAVTAYPIATLTGSKNAGLAKAWVEYVKAHDNELRAAGFLAP
jgi:molybdate transport system substrate-binding protein